MPPNNISGKITTVSRFLAAGLQIVDAMMSLIFIGKNTIATSVFAEWNPLIVFLLKSFPHGFVIYLAFKYALAIGILVLPVRNNKDRVALLIIAVVYFFITVINLMILLGMV